MNEGLTFVTRSRKKSPINENEIDYNRKNIFFSSPKIENPKKI
jgi:hypothetical protein